MYIFAHILNFRGRIHPYTKIYNLNTDMNTLIFKHTLPIQLRFNDIDTQGHVNNTVYFSFYDLGKTTYFYDIMSLKALDKVGIVVANINADFLTPIVGQEPIAAQTAVKEVGTKSFTLIQQIINTETMEIKCRCQSVMVAFDLKTHQAIEVPAEWKNAFEAYEGRELSRTKS